MEDALPRLLAQYKARVWLTLWHHEYTPKLHRLAPQGQEDAHAQTSASARANSGETSTTRVVYGNAGDGWQAVPVEMAMPRTAWVAHRNERDARTTKRSKMSVNVDASQMEGNTVLLAFQPVAKDTGAVPLYATRGVAVTDVELGVFAGGGRGETVLRRAPVRGLPNACTFAPGSEPIPNHRAVFGAPPWLFLNVDVAGAANNAEVLKDKPIAWHVRGACVSMPATELVSAILSLANPQLCRTVVSSILAPPPSTSQQPEEPHDYQIDVEVATLPGHHTKMRNLARFVGYACTSDEAAGEGETFHVQARCFPASSHLSDLQWGSCLLSATVVRLADASIVGSCCCALDSRMTTGGLNVTLHHLNARAVASLAHHRAEPGDDSAHPIASGGSDSCEVHAFAFAVVERAGASCAVDADVTLRRSRGRSGGTAARPPPRRV